ncbi:MAG TPA: hypothetical protein VMR52_11915 [Dehalococcoidia bacterium]|nr:hypothetical protein [Dehalococcoidia bacterium]
MKALLMLLAALAVALFAACGDDDDDDDDAGETTSPDASETAPAEPTTPAPATGECEPNTAQPAAGGDLTWDAVLPATIPAPEGWVVADAEGDAPLLAVSNPVGIVGTVELLQFDLPFEPSGGFEAMADWADGLYGGVQIDRDAPGLNISLDEPAPVSFGEFCGISYGYTITNEDGAVIERYEGRATFDAAKLYLVVALYDQAIAAEQGFQSAEALAEYEPFLTPLVESLEVPAD